MVTLSHCHGTCRHFAEVVATQTIVPLFSLGAPLSPHHNNPPVYSIMANNYLSTVSFIHKKKEGCLIYLPCFLDYTTRRVIM